MKTNRRSLLKNAGLIGTAFAVGTVVAKGATKADLSAPKGPKPQAITRDAGKKSDASYALNRPGVVKAPAQAAPLPAGATVKSVRAQTKRPPK